MSKCLACFKEIDGDAYVIRDDFTRLIICKSCYPRFQLENFKARGYRR